MYSFYFCTLLALRHNLHHYYLPSISLNLYYPFYHPFEKVIIIITLKSKIYYIFIYVLYNYLIDIAIITDDIKCKDVLDEQLNLKKLQIYYKLQK